MKAKLSQLRSPLAVQAALDEYARLGRAEFLHRHGFDKARAYLVRNPSTGELCDSKAIVAVAYGHEHPDEGPLKPSDFSGGEATVMPMLRSLGFEVVRIGEDWTAEEVDATVDAYFEMLLLESRQQPYNKSERNAALRMLLRGRTRASVELKHQNVSAVLRDLELPTIDGYKPRGNAQLLLRKAVQRFVRARADVLGEIVEAMDARELPERQRFKAVVVDPPSLETVARVDDMGPRARLPRRIDHAARDDRNRALGRAGEQWVLAFEHWRLAEAGQADLFQRVDWVSERLGDGAGYDILSFDSAERARYIEVKTTNGARDSSFVISRNELEFAAEAGPAFHLYRVFRFRDTPALYMLQGDLSRHLHLEAMDFRASFKKLSS